MPRCSRASRTRRPRAARNSGSVAVTVTGPGGPMRRRIGRFTLLAAFMDALLLASASLASNILHYVLYMTAGICILAAFYLLTRIHSCLILQVRFKRGRRSMAVGVRA